MQRFCLSNRGWPPGFLGVPPVDSRQKITELRRRYRHRAIGDGRPEKAPAFEPFRIRQTPWPSCQMIFKRSPLRPRKQNRWPLFGSRFSDSCTNSDRRGKPLRISVCPVASQTRTPLGTGIILPFSSSNRPTANSIDRPHRECGRGRGRQSPHRSGQPGCQTAQSRRNAGARKDERQRQHPDPAPVPQGVRSRGHRNRQEGRPRSCASKRNFRIQRQIDDGSTSYRRATATTLASSSSADITISSFKAVGQCRRRPLSRTRSIRW